MFREVDSRSYSIFDSIGGFLHDDASLSKVKKLEGKWNKLILDEEIYWRIKTRPTWIAHGDSNTK